MNADLFSQLFWPLLRLIATMCVGLLVAGLLEGLHWTRFVARLAAPLAKAGRLRQVAAASFALAFFSPASSNALLSEAHGRGEISRRELIFSNLFNSSPTFLVHLPSLFSLVFAFLGSRAFVYVGLTFAAAALRTCATLAAGRIFLPKPDWTSGEEATHESRAAGSAKEIARRVFRRFQKRIRKLLLFTVPVYCLFFAAGKAGFFAAAEGWLASHAAWLSFLDPKAISIVAISLVSESGAALSAAASLADTGALGGHQIVLALLIGNILSSPMRAARHQFPSYAGYFAPALAFHLVVMNQLCRAASLGLVAFVYYLFAF